MKHLYKVLLGIWVCFISINMGNGQLVSANEYETFQDESIVYSIIDTHTVEVSGYTGNEKELSIPQKVNGYRVTSIGKEAFFYNDVIQKVVLPETIERIGDEAFAGSTLENINLPQTVHEVGYLAFELTPIFEKNMENGVSYIDGICVGGEQDCLLEVVTEDELMTVDIRPDTRLISNYAFIRNMYIKEVRIPESVKCIGQGAFYRCENLREVDIALNVKVSESAFDKCDNLKVVTGDKEYLEKCAGFNHTPFRTKIIAKRVASIGSAVVLTLAIVGIVFRRLLTNRGGQIHGEE